MSRRGRGGKNRNKRAQAKAKAARRLDVAQKKTGLSKRQIKSIMRNKNLGGNISNQKELQKVLKVAKNQSKKNDQNKRNNKPSNNTNQSNSNQRQINQLNNKISNLRKELRNKSGGGNTDGTDSKEYKSLNDKYTDLKSDYDKKAGAYDQKVTDYTTLTTSFGTISGENQKLRESNKEYEEKIEGLNTTIGDYDTKISGYKDTIGGYDSKISKYKTDFSDLTDKYEGVVKSNTTLTSERDEAKKAMEAQSAAYESAKSERDLYREFSVGEQLAGLRGGATYGGANQTSYGSGDLSSGRSGYSSSTQERDKGLADYVMQEGGATDSVLNREGPVVQLMGGNRRRGRGQSVTQSVAGRTNAGGTGSYYASRFGG